jgi:hypothetical protein
VDRANGEVDIGTEWTGQIVRWILEQSGQGKKGMDKMTSIKDPHFLCCSLSHIGEIKPARTWGLNGAEEKYIRRVGGDVKEKIYLSDLEVDGRIRLK